MSCRYVGMDIFLAVGSPVIFPKILTLYSPINRLFPEANTGSNTDRFAHINLIFIL